MTTTDQATHEINVVVNLADWADLSKLNAIWDATGLDHWSAGTDMNSGQRDMQFPTTEAEAPLLEARITKALQDGGFGELIHRIEVVKLRPESEADAVPHHTSFGWEVGPSEFGPRGIIAVPELSMAGNIVLHVGNENTGPEDRLAPGGWFKVAHVVLTPAETIELIAHLATNLVSDPPQPRS